jgi:hypothetical protein
MSAGKQPIAVRELDPTAHLALEHNQLTSERGILSLKPADRPERRNQQPQKEEEQRDHRGRHYVIPSSDQTDEVFGIHNPQIAYQVAPATLSFVILPFMATRLRRCAGQRQLPTTRELSRSIR